MISNNVNSQKKHTVFARLFVFIPANNDNAVIIRRGPSKVVGLFSWNTCNDKIDEFQWVKGRIYEYFSDISPDGKYFLYSANKRGLGYTAISRTPWLKAISFWNNVGSRGGGVFTGNNQYTLLSDSYNKFKCKEVTHSTKSWHQIKNGVYPYRLEKMGWNLIIRQDADILFRKKIKDNLVLEKIWKRNIGREFDVKGEFFEYHRVVINSENIECPDWEWCEWLKNSLVWAQNGCLFRTSLDANNHIGVPQLIHDFNQYEFKEKKAPY